VHNYTANPIHKSYAAFKVAFLAVLGVVLIFNSKPSKESQAVINQSTKNKIQKRSPQDYNNNYFWVNCRFSNDEDVG